MSEIKKRTVNLAIEFDFLVTEIEEAVNLLEQMVAAKRPGIKCFLTDSETGEQFIYDFDNQQLTEMGTLPVIPSDLPRGANGIRFTPAGALS